MEDIIGHVGGSSRPHPIKAPVNITDLTESRRVVFEIDNEGIENIKLEEDELDLDEEPEPVAEYNISAYGNNQKSKPFIHSFAINPHLCFASFYDEEQFAEMINVQEKGAVKKSIIREGDGPLVPNNCHVFVHYILCGEGMSEPFDSTLQRGHPDRLDLRVMDILPGLFLAVKSMRMREVAKVWIRHDFAYGEFGCPPRIPPKTNMHCIVEVLDVIDEDKLKQVSFMSNAERQSLSFQQIYECSEQLRNAGRSEYQDTSYWLAVKSYRKAINILEDYSTFSQEDSDKRQELLYILYNNLSQCYLKVRRPQQVCTSCRLALRNAEPPKTIDAKLYYRFAEAKLMLGGFKDAKNLNKEALRREPNNVEILEQQKRIENGIKQDTLMTNMTYEKMAKGFFNQPNKPKEPTAKKETEKEATSQTISKSCSTDSPVKEPDEEELPSFEWGDDDIETLASASSASSNKLLEERLVVGQGLHGPSFSSQKKATIYDLVVNDLQKKKTDTKK